MNILALDLGTKCGWALWRGSHIDSGTINFMPTRFTSHGMKFSKFKDFLEKCIDPDVTCRLVDHIVFEEVRNHMAVDAAHSYGGFLAVLQVVALECGISYEGVPVGTIKKFATGKGNAKKPEMIKAANRLFPSVNVVDDNHADALCLLAWATRDEIS